LIDNRGRVKIADFGNSVLKATPEQQLRFEGKDFEATPLWAAPEAFGGSFDYKCDIWGLGCVIIEMASAKWPWSECQFQNPMQAMFHIGRSDKRPECPKSLSVACQSFVAKCLARDPKDRYDTTQLLNHRFLRPVERRPGGNGYKVDRRND